MVSEDKDNIVVFAQTPILKTQLEALKLLAGTTTTKDALQAAVNHYLNCPVIRERSNLEEEKKEDSGKAFFKH
ncbi:MAG: DUF5371 family protein [Euryarchaeota archaeon]|nr:DUF5371 family protein [Euryarchaeota archaeon]